MIKAFLVTVAVLMAAAVPAQAQVHQAAPLTCDNNGRCTQAVVAQRCAASKIGQRHCRRAARRAQRSPIAPDPNGNPMRRSESVIAVERGYCHPNTAAGPIFIDCALAPQMKGFIRDVVARGFRGRVHCFSLSHSHVPHSLHKRARACDFAQYGWGKTVRVMHHVADLARKWGLRDGCSFHGRRGPDCGHIDSGRSGARVAAAR
ncbi:MAG: hypothetical protein GC182_08805 [Rhodopseudomonas sp.]|nr:hypothetical protein [Rhodopseudomonas sp.]